MKQFLTSVAVAVLVVTAQGQNTWLQLDSVKGPPKSVCASFVANGEGYCVSGLEYFGFTRKMYSYNPVQNDWDTEESIGGVNGGGLSRGSAVAFSIYDKGYICTGQGDNTDFLNDMWEFDPLLDVWTQKAIFPGSPRRGAVAFVLGGFGYVGTGEDTSGFKKDFYKYDPNTNAWGNVADFSGTARKQAVGFAIGNQGYVGTGDDGILRNDFWQYQEFQNAWVQKANFPGTPRAGATGWGYFPAGFIATGEDNTFTYMNDVWEYNYFTNQWLQRTSLPGPGRKHAISFMIGNIAYLGTGYDGAFLDDFYAYTAIVGVNEATSTTSDILVYPNPIVDHFTLFYSGQLNSTATVTLLIYSSVGQDVSSQFAVARSNGSFNVLRSDAKLGTYFCVLLDDTGNTVAVKEIVLL